MSTNGATAREAAERYERVIVAAILGPFARALVEAAGPRPGETVLDVGCGTGAAARHAAERVGPSGRVLALDVNPGMLEVARALPAPPGAAIVWREGDAHALPIPDRSVDLLLAAQVIQFLPDRARALAEAARVLRPGGRMAWSTWCPLAENVYFDALVSSVSRHLGEEAGIALMPAFALTDGEEIDRLVADAGLARGRRTTLEIALPLPDPIEFVPRHVRATSLAEVFDGAAPEVRESIAREIALRLRPYGMESGARVPFRAHAVLAERRRG